MSDYAELGELLSAMAEGTLDDAGRRRLAALLRDDAGARAFYRRYLRVHLLMDMEAGAERVAVETKPIATRAVAGWLYAIASVAAALLIGGAAIAVWLTMVAGSGSGPREGDGVASAPLGVVLDSVGVSWDSEPIEPGDNVTARHLAIASGRLEMNLNSGTQIDLTGPARMTLTGDGSVRLDGGMLHAVAAPGFVVSTPSGVRITDLGTEFVVNVAADGAVRVGVIDGRVATRSADGDTQITGRSAVVFDRGGSLVERIDAAAGLDAVALYLFDTDTDADRPEERSPAPALIGGSALGPTGDRAYVGDLPLGDGTDNWLIEARVRADTADGIGLVVYHGNPAESGYGLIRSGDRWSLVYGGVVVVPFGPPVQIGRWTRIAAARQAGVTRLFVDGLPVDASTPAAPRAPTTHMHVGGLSASVPQAFGGAIERVRISRLTAPLEPAMLLSDPILDGARGPVGTEE